MRQFIEHGQRRLLALAKPRRFPDEQLMSFTTIEHEGKQVRVAVVRVPKGVWIGYPGGARFYRERVSGTRRRHGRCQQRRLSPR